MGSWITVETLMGLLAGAVLILFEMVAAMMINQPPDAGGFVDEQEETEAG